MIQINRAAMDAQMNREAAKKRNLCFLGISIIFSLLATSFGVCAFYGFGLREILLIGFVAVVNVIFAILSFAGILTLNRHIDSKAQEEMSGQEKFIHPNSPEGLKLRLEADRSAVESEFVEMANYVVHKRCALVDENNQFDVVVINDYVNDFLKLFTIYDELKRYGEPKDEINIIYNFARFIFNLIPFQPETEVSETEEEEEIWDDFIEVK